MTATLLPIHPLCASFPDIPDDEFQEFVESIKKRGLREKITIYDGQVVDGKNRQRACEAAGVKPVYQDWVPPTDCKTDEEIESALLFFISDKNERRRHNNASQRAMSAAKLLTAKSGENQFTRVNRFTPSVSVADAAKAMNVSDRYVQHASRIMESGTDSLIKAVEKNEVHVSDAAKIVGLPRQEQAAAVRAVRTGKARSVAQAAGIKKPKKPQAIFSNGADLEALKTPKTLPVAPSPNGHVDKPANQVASPVATAVPEAVVAVVAPPVGGAFGQIHQKNWRAAFGVVVKMNDEWKAMHIKDRAKLKLHAEFYALSHALLKKWCDMNPGGRWS